MRWRGAVCLAMKTAALWSPTPPPMRAEATYVVRHGFGYSVFETPGGHGIVSELWVYVATDAAIKFSVLKLRGTSPGGRAGCLQPLT